MRKVNYYSCPSFLIDTCRYIVIDILVQMEMFGSLRPSQAEPLAVSNVSGVQGY